MSCGGRGRRTLLGTGSDRPSTVKSVGMTNFTSFTGSVMSARTTKATYRPSGMLQQWLATITTSTFALTRDSSPT